jgi:hypothetical protein
MKTLKRFSASLVLSTLFCLTALAGETHTPPCTNPGEVNTPPSAVPSETSSPPGETLTPPSPEVVGMGVAVALELTMFW